MGHGDFFNVNGDSDESAWLQIAMTLNPLITRNGLF